MIRACGLRDRIPKMEREAREIGAQIEALTVRKLSLEQTISELRALLEETDSDNRTLRDRFEDFCLKANSPFGAEEACRVLGHPLDLKQTIHNLINTACKQGRVKRVGYGRYLGVKGPSHEGDLS